MRVGAALVLMFAWMQGAHAQQHPGQAIYTANCVSCHGADGSTPFVSGNLTLQLNDAIFRESASNNKALFINAFLNGAVMATVNVTSEQIAKSMNYVYAELNTPAINEQMTALEIDGAKIFDMTCSTANCHGKTGAGDQYVPPIDDAAFRSRPRSTAIQKFLNGVTIMVDIGGTPTASVMPAYNTMSDSDKIAVLTYVYESINNLGAVSAGEFSADLLFTSSGASINENTGGAQTPDATVIGTVSVASTDSPSYSIISDDAKIFGINSSTGVISLTVAVSFDKESQDEYPITLRVSTSGGLSSQGLYVVNIIDVDEAPLFTGQFPKQQAIVTASDDATFTFHEAVDLEGDAVAYSATFANDSALSGGISFNTSTRVFTVASGTSTRSRRLKIRAEQSDDSTKFVEQEFDLQILTFSSLPEQRVRENQNTQMTPLNTAVATLQLSSSSSETYIMHADDSGKFGVRSSTGAIYLLSATNFNHEGQRAYWMTIRITDSGSMYDVPFVIRTRGFHEPPYFPSQFPDQRVNSATEVTITFHEALDQEGDKLLYAATFADGTAFSSSSGFSFNTVSREIVIAAGTSAGTYRIKVTADETGDHRESEDHVDQEFNVIVTEEGIVIGNLGLLSLDRDNANLPVRLAAAPVGGNVTLTISTTSAEISTAPATMIFSSGSWSADQNLTVSVTAQGKGNKGLNNQNPYNIDIEVYDKSNSATNYRNVDKVVVPVAVTISNFSPALPESERMRSIDENIGGVMTAIGTNVGAPLDADDPDNLDTDLTFRLVVESPVFNISPRGQIQVKVATEFDHETTGSYLVTVQVEDNGGFVVNRGVTVEVVTIHVNDVPERPVLGDLDNQIVTAGTAGTYVFDAATDQDDGDAARLTYNAVQINSGSSALPTGVSFDGPTRTFTFAASLTAPLEATIQVTASDGSLTSSPQTFTLQVRSASAVGSTGRAVADDSGLVALSRSTREVEFDVRLSVEPQSKAVTLTITSMDASDVSIMPATMEFDDTDWNVVQKATARLEDVDTKGDRVVAMQIAVYNKATSDGYYTNSQDLNVNITVANANAAPVFDLDAIAAIDFSIDETEGKTTVGGSGADLGTPVVATDADNDDATELVYSLVGASSQFAIDAGTGQLSAVAVANLNYERQSSHELVVQVSDGETSGDPGVDEGIAMVTVTVGINNVDEKPSAYNSSSFQVDGAGRNDITLSWNNNDFEAEFDAEDRDAVVILYEGGGYSGVEVLEATVTMFVLGGLVPGVSYDIDITWQTVDSISQDTPEGVQGGNQTTAANAAPVLGGVTFSRAENEGTAVTPAGTVVATVSATDDDGDALTYSIRGGADAGLFVIDAQGGEVRLARSVNFDRETKASYTFNVAATDAYGAMSAAGALVLNITAVDEDPALPLQYAQTATEGVERMFMVRGAAEATDPEGESGSVQFQASLVGGDVLHPWLTLDRATGQFTVGRDSVAGTYNILVRAVFVPSISSLVAPAGGGPVALNVISERMFVLEVQASGSTNTAPDFSSATTEFMIAENSEQDAGETVGTVAAADGQTAASALVYSLRGDDAAGFAIGANGALVIGASAVTFDRESKQEYNFVVDVVDGDGGLASTEVEVEITNVDEAPEFPAIAQRSFQVLARAQSTFFAPQAFDPEGSAVTYTASNPGSWLTFDAMKAEFTVGVSAPPGSHRVTITASDGSLTSEHQFMVQVQTAGNSPPVIMNSVAGVLALPGFVLDSSGTTLAEGTEIGRVVATDDVDGDLTYVMVDDGVSRPFDIDSETGVIEVVDDTHNFTAQVYLVTVGVFDEQGGISWVDVRIEFAVRVLAPRPPATVAPAGAQQQDEVAAVVMDRAMAVATADMLRARLDVPVPASSGAALLYQSKDENALSLLRMASAVDQWQDWRSPESGSIADHGERMKWRDFLSARGFDLALDDGGGRGGVRGRLWGSGSNSTVDGDPILGNLQVVYDGDVKTYLMGLDLVMADNRLGIAFGQSQAELMLGSGKDVHVERDLNLVHPYLSFGLSRNVRIWATGGYGTGDYIRIDASGASEQKTTRKSSYLSAAGGVEGNLVTDKSFEVVVGVQALAVRSALEGVTAALSLPETDASFWRAQADIESSWSFNLLGDVALRPFFGAHLRHDDGDDWLSDDAFDTSAGMSLNWLGLRAEFSSRSQGNEERYDASISYDYAMDGRGLMLSVSPSIAGSDGELSDRSMSSRFDYVLPVRLFGESGVATFNAGFSATETSLAEDYGFRFAGRRLDVGLGAADGSYRIDFTVR